MMDPGMQGAPMPPMGAAPDPSQMGAPMAPPSPIDAVLAALQGMQAQRQSEDDAVLAAVMKATGAGMPPGVQGATEGAPFATPDMGGAPTPDPSAMGPAGGMGY